MISLKARSLKVFKNQEQVVKKRKKKMYLRSPLMTSRAR